VKRYNKGGFVLGQQPEGLLNMAKNNYSDVEKIDLVALGGLTLLFLGGFGLCFLSFHEGKLIRPALNLLGLILLYFLPQLIALATMLGRELSREGIWRFMQPTVEKFGGYIFLSAPIAYYFSSGSGYISGAAVIGSLLAWIAAMAAAYAVNERWRSRIPKPPEKLAPPES
jgi:hypothetical protein